MENFVINLFNVVERFQTGNKSKGNANRRKLTDFLCKEVLFVFILFKLFVSNTQRIVVVRHLIDLVSCR